MTVKPETIADLESIFLEGTEALRRHEAQETEAGEELITILERLDTAVTFGGGYFTPEAPAPNRSYYGFINLWHELRETIPAEVNAHYDETLKSTTVAMFQRHFDGLVIEAVAGKRDLDFLAECLDELIALTCPNGCEDETPFVCVPERRQVLALKRIGTMEGLEHPDDVEALLDHLTASEAVWGERCFALDDSAFEFVSSTDLLKSVQLF